MLPNRAAMRRFRFWLLEKLVLPIGVVALRMLMRTWRTEGPGQAMLDDMAALPRMIIPIWHGSLLEALAFAPLAPAYGQRWGVLVTPSLDGLFAAAAIKRLGVDHVPLASGVRGLAAADAFLRRVEARDWCVILADGPRGPRHTVKPGVARTAAAANATIVAAGFAASRAIRLRSWDRTSLPAPFARVALACRIVPLPPAGVSYSTEAIQAALEEAMDDAGQRLGAGRSRGPLSATPMNV